MDTAEGEDRKGQTEVKRGGGETVAEKRREGKESDASAGNAGEVIQHAEEIFSSPFSRISSSFPSLKLKKKQNTLTWHPRYKGGSRHPGTENTPARASFLLALPASGDATFLISCSSLAK